LLALRAHFLPNIAENTLSASNYLSADDRLFLPLPASGGPLTLPG